MNLLRKISNVLLALLLLVTTTGVTLNKHYCMGRLVSVAVYVDADPCDNGMEDPMPCCQDIQEELRIEEIAETSFDFESHTSSYLLAVIANASTEALTFAKVTPTSFHNYRPPLPDRDVLVLHQVFII